MIPEGPLHGPEFVGGLLVAALAMALTSRRPNWRAPSLMGAVVVVAAIRLGSGLVNDIVDHSHFVIGIVMVLFIAASCGLLAVVARRLGPAAALAATAATWAIVPDTELAVVVAGVLLGAQAYSLVIERSSGLAMGPFGSALIGTLPVLAAISGSVGRPQRLFTAGIWAVVAVATLVGFVVVSELVFPAPSHRRRHRQ